jgi:hypothetical protein
MKPILILLFVTIFLLGGILLKEVSNNKKIEKATEEIQTKRSVEFATNAFLP